jgi:hypothetical protein
MNYYNVKDFLDHVIGEEYDYDEHHWINIQLPCGCIHAICTDIVVGEDDEKQYYDLSNKYDTINMYLKQLASDEYSVNDEKIINLLDEKRITTHYVKNFIDALRKKHNVAINCDYNGNEIFLKLLKGEKCTS